MTPTRKTNPRRRTGRVARSKVLVTLRGLVSPFTLGRIDWRLYGRQENPYPKNTPRHESYARGFLFEKQLNPETSNTRLRRPKK